MNTPPKLTDEQINDLPEAKGWWSYSEAPRALRLAKATADFRDQQWLDMLADQCAQLVLERDELMKQVQRYEKHGVTCQTYRHHVAGCGECNNEAPQPPQQPATGFGPKLIPQVSGFVAPQPPQQPAEWVGLTDEEIDKTYETEVWDARRSYARAIETKLREKNGAGK